MAQAERPTWELVLDAANDLSRVGVAEFTRLDLIDRVHLIDPGRSRSTIDPIIQGMTANAPGGPVSACGAVLRRV